MKRDMEKNFSPLSVHVVGQKKVRMSTNKTAVMYVGLILIGLIGGLYYCIGSYSSSQKKPMVKKLEIRQDASQLVLKIGALYDLPQGEQPTIATVSDKTKLQKQTFFAKAENGDKVIIYTQAKKAILYRPSINKVIEVAPLALSTKSAPTISPQIETSSSSATF